MLPAAVGAPSPVANGPHVRFCESTRISHGHVHRRRRDSLTNRSLQQHGVRRLGLPCLPVAGIPPIHGRTRYNDRRFRGGPEQMKRVPSPG